MRSTNGNTENLFQPITANTESAFNDLFRQHHAQLVLFASRLTEDQAAAEDIVEDALITLWQRRDALSQIKSVKSYLYAIVRNGCLSRIRKNRRESEKHQAAFEAAPEFENSVLENMIYSETMGRIYRAMDLLPKQCRKVFFMYYIQRKKIAEIAEELNISVGTVKTHKGRGIQILRKSLSGLIFLIYFSF